MSSRGRKDSKSRDKGETSIKCLKCSRVLDTDSQALECNMCSGWTCLRCTGLSLAVYKGMTDEDMDNCMYVCQGCLGSLPTLKKISKNVEEIKESTSVRFDKLETRVDNIEDNMKATVSDEVQKLKDDLKTEIFHEFDQKLKEREELDKRADNLIFFNVPEIESDTLQAKASHDLAIVKKVCERVGVKDPNIVQLFRLGQKKDNIGKNRPLKVRFAIKAQRRIVLINSKKIATGDEEIKPISVARDLTQNQRNDYKVKVKAVKEAFDERVNNGETDIVMRGLRIVKVSGADKDSESESASQAPF